MYLYSQQQVHMMEIISTSKTELLNFIVPSQAMCNGKSKEIYGYLLFTSCDGVLTVTGSDGNQTMTKQLEMNNETYATNDGQLCVEGEKLVRVLRSMAENKAVNISMLKDKTDKALIRCGRSRIQLQTIAASKYPQVEQIGDEAQSVSLATSTLLTVLKQTVYAVAKKDVRYYLMAVNLKCENGYLTATSTDGHRLVTQTIEVAASDNVVDMELLLPANAVNTLLKISGEGELSIRYDDNKVEFACGDGLYRTQLVDGRFPDIKRVIPTEADCLNTFRAEKGAIMEVINRLTSAVDSDHKSGLSIESESSDTVRCAVTSNTDAESEDWIDCTFTGEPLKVKFNPRYIEDATRHMPSDDVVLHFDRDGKMLMRPVGDFNISAVVMPQR